MKDEMDPSLDTLIEAELRWIEVYDTAYRKMLDQDPGTESAARLSRLVTEANAKISELRKQVRNHPDHSYDGL